MDLQNRPWKSNVPISTDSVQPKSKPGKSQQCSPILGTAIINTMVAEMYAMI